MVRRREERKEEERLLKEKEETTRKLVEEEERVRIEDEKERVEWERVEKVVREEEKREEKERKRKEKERERKKKMKKKKKELIAEEELEMRQKSPPQKSPPIITPPQGSPCSRLPPPSDEATTVDEAEELQAAAELMERQAREFRERADKIRKGKEMAAAGPSAKPGEKGRMGDFDLQDAEKFLVGKLEAEKKNPNVVWLGDP
jgi:hypothetical protein